VACALITTMLVGPKSTHTTEATSISSAHSGATTSLKMISRPRRSTPLIKRQAISLCGAIAAAAATEAEETEAGEQCVGATRTAQQLTSRHLSSSEL
jgi:hypothetical protein